MRVLRSNFISPNCCAAFSNAEVCELAALVMRKVAISQVCPVLAGCVTESGSWLHAVQGLRLI